MSDRTVPLGRPVALNAHPAAPVHVPLCSPAATRRTWPGLPEHARAARHWVHDRLADHGPDVVHTAGIVVTELFSNAVRHTRSGDRGGRVEVTVDVGDPWIFIGITDEGAATVPAIPEPDPVDPLPTSGMGLAILSQLAVEWGHREIGSGRITWAMVAR